MGNKQSHWLDSKKHFGGQKPGLALVKWLNDPPTSPKFVEDLLSHAQLVSQGLAEYPSLHQLNVARKKKKLAPEFWDSYQKVNEMLATFTYAPQIDLHDFYDGERVSLTLVTEQPIALYSVQVRWVLQLIEQRAILKIRRCEECESWFFAQFAHRKFRKTSCQIKHFAGSEKFKEKRRIRAKNPPEFAQLAETLRSQLRSAGIKARGFPSCINYGIEVDGDFITLLSVSATNMWFPLPQRAVRALGDERFVACKQKINNVVAFYRPEDVSEPTKTNTLGPRFGALDGKVEAFVEAVTEIAETVRGAVTEAS